MTMNNDAAITNGHQMAQSTNVARLAMTIQQQMIIHGKNGQPRNQNRFPNAIISIAVSRLLQQVPTIVCQNYKCLPISLHGQLQQDTTCRIKYNLIGNLFVKLYLYFEVYCISLFSGNRLETYCVIPVVYVLPNAPIYQNDQMIVDNTKTRFCYCILLIEVLLEAKVFL